MKEKSPAFQFYPKDYLASSSVMAMSLAQQGAYLRLLCTQWLDGSISGDIAKLARICGISAKEMARLWPDISACFESRDDGSLINGRLEAERRSQEAYRERVSKAARTGAEGRWGKCGGNATALPPHCKEPDAVAQDEQCGSMPPQFASSSTPASAREELPPAVVPAAGVAAAKTKAKKPAASFVSVETGVTFLDKLPEIDSTEMRSALADWLSVIEGEGKAASAAHLMKQLQKCKPWGHDKALAALRLSADRRFPYIAEPFAERVPVNGYRKLNGRDGIPPGHHPAIASEADVIQRMTFDQDPERKAAAQREYEATHPLLPGISFDPAGDLRHHG